MKREIDPKEFGNLILKGKAFDENGNRIRTSREHLPEKPAPPPEDKTLDVVAEAANKIAESNEETVRGLSAIIASAMDELMKEVVDKGQVMWEELDLKVIRKNFKCGNIFIPLIDKVTVKRIR